MPSPQQELQLLATLLFSEASKDKNMESDSRAIASVVMNRMKRPERFGQTLTDVVMAPSQFSGVGSNEWKKVIEGKLNSEEESIFKKQIQIAGGVMRGTIADETAGADHYFNPKIVQPSWAKKMTKLHSTGSHDYYKE